MRPAAPASRPPSRNVSEIVVSTLMPISRAASGSCAVARIALPRRLRVMNGVSRKTSGTVTATASTSPRWIGDAADGEERRCDWWIRSGDRLPASEPSHRRPTFCRMNEKPTAVISGASFGALRSGR